MIRASGREYNGLIDSPCLRDATDPERTLSCVSCHTMHKTEEDTRSIASWADTHQVSADSEGDDACLQCHQPLAENLTAHTNHPVESTGSHMPYTTYGLMKALRSHEISTPSVATTLETGRPNTCNLCHLDQTLAWTADRLDNWYDTAAPPLDADQRTVAASVLWILAGSPAQRALVGWSLGWPPAQETSGTGWMMPYLAELLGDPYDAVRYFADGAMRTLAGYEDVRYDFGASSEQRVADALTALQRWRDGPLSRQPPTSSHPLLTEAGEPDDAGATSGRTALLFDADGVLDLEEIARLFGQRDNRPMFLRE